MSDPFTHWSEERFWRQLEYGDTQGAIESARTALAAEPDSGQLHSMLALALLAAKRPYAARHEAAIARELEPELPLAHLAFGNALLAARRFNEGLAALEQAVALAPQTSELHEALGAGYLVTRRFEQAHSALQRALEIDPENLDAMVRLGDLAWQQGQRVEAEAWYLRALASAPAHLNALVGQGRVLLERGEVERARDHALWALQQHANDEGALLLLCAVAARRNRVMGLWWRLNSWLTLGGQRRTLMLLIGGYLLFNLSSLLLTDSGYPAAGSAVGWLWIGLALYSWIGPFWFLKMVERELARVEVKAEY